MAHEHQPTLHLSPPCTGIVARFARLSATLTQGGRRKEEGTSPDTKRVLPLFSFLLPPHLATSAVTLGELYRGAFRSPRVEFHLRNIAERVLTAITALPYDAATAEHYGRIAAALERRGQRPADADLQIAATALRHDLELVTGNTRHFARVPGLRINAVLSAAR